jgi:hypothetical protein
MFHARPVPTRQEDLQEDHEARCRARILDELGLIVMGNALLFGNRARVDTPQKGELIVAQLSDVRGENPQRNKLGLCVAHDQLMEH